MSDLRERAAIAVMREMVCKLGHGIYHPKDLAIEAVKCADALLAELASTSPVRPENAPQPSVPNEVLQPGTKLYVFQDGQPKVTAEVPPELRCTAAERELIEAAYMQETAPTDLAWSRYMAAIHAVRAERRAASEAKGGEQP